MELRSRNKAPYQNSKLLGLAISHSELYDEIIFQVPHQVGQAKLLGVVETEPEVILQFCNESTLFEGYVEDPLAVVLHSLRCWINCDWAIDYPGNLFLGLQLRLVMHKQVVP